MLEWLERRFKSAYLKKLEDDNRRLTDELRQLMNSILASHGMPGIDAPRSNKTFEPLKRPNWLHLRASMERKAEERRVAELKAARQVATQPKDAA